MWGFTKDHLLPTNPFIFLFELIKKEPREYI